MATRRRFSRGVPYVLTDSDKQALLRTLEQDPEMRSDVETILGKDFARLTDDEKITALRNFENAGFGAAVLADMAKARRALRREADYRRGVLDAEDRELMLAEQIEVLRENIEVLRDELAAEQAKNTRSASGRR